MIHVPEDYHNDAIDFSRLQPSDKIVLTPLHPRFYKQMVIEVSLWPIFIIVISIIAYIYLHDLTNPWAYWLPIGGLTLFAVLHLLWMKKAFRVRGYSVRERDVSVRKGLFFRRTITVPISKIQQVTIKQSVIERALGLYKLDISDGSQGAIAVVIPGLTEERANELRDHLLSKLS